MVSRKNQVNGNHDRTSQGVTNNSPAISPTSSTGSGKRTNKSSNKKKAPECSTAPMMNSTRTTITNHSKKEIVSAELRERIIQEQVRSLRRRLWRAFAEDDPDTALRAYTSTTHDLQQWVRNEVQEAHDRLDRQRQEAQVCIVLCVYIMEKVSFVLDVGKTRILGVSNASHLSTCYFLFFTYCFRRRRMHNDPP